MTGSRQSADWERTIDRSRLKLEPGVRANGAAFGCSQYALFATVGAPDAVQELASGEVEFAMHGDLGCVVYRCFHHRFVEVTCPAEVRFEVAGVRVLDAEGWLGQQPDCLDIAGFRISAKAALAYDRRAPDSRSITAFARGHWDTLIEHIKGAGHGDHAGTHQDQSRR